MSEVSRIMRPNSRMLTTAGFSPGNQRHEIFEEEWYMNKLSASGLMKILKSPTEKIGKIRSIDNILADSENMRWNQTELENSAHTWDECEGLSCFDKKMHATWGVYIEDGIPVKNNAMNENTEYETQSIFSSQAWMPLCGGDGNDIDVEKMTIKEMHQLLKKATQMSKDKRPSSVIPSAASTASVDCEDGPRDSKLSLTSDDTMPMGALELHLDSSTSNSMDSSDDTGGIGSSYSKPGSLNSEANIFVSKVDESTGLASKKRKAECWTDSGAAGALTTVEADQDEWTLGMWQWYHKQHSRQKKSKVCSHARNLRPSDSILKQSISGVPSTCNEPSAICSFSSAPVVDPSFPPTRPSQENVAVQDASTKVAEDLCNDKPGPKICNNKLPAGAVPSKCAVQDDVGFQGCQNAGPEDLSNSEPPDEDLYSRGISLDEISKVKLQKNQIVQEHGSSLARESVRLVLEDESEVHVSNASSPVECFTKTVSWALKACIRNPVCTDSETSGQILSKQTINDESVEVCDKLDLKKRGSAVSLPIDSKLGFKRIQSSNQKSLTDSGAAVSRLSGPVRIDSVTELANDVSCCSENSSRHDDQQGNGESVRIENTDESFYATEFSFSSFGELKPKLKKESSELPLSVLAAEMFDVEEERNGGQHKPAKLPCKRNTISPLSREKLLQASNFRECGFKDQENGSCFRRPKRLSPSFTGYIGQDGFHREGIDLSIRKRGVRDEVSNGFPRPSGNIGQKAEAPLGSPCHSKNVCHILQKPLPAKTTSFNISSLSGPTANTILDVAVPSEYTASHAQNLSLPLNNLPSLASQQATNAFEIENGNRPGGFSPLVPTKGILRSSSLTCLGACRCEECVSVRARAEKASAFSQRQMQDIEGLAGKLMKELSTMRTIVEEAVLQVSPSSQGPRSTLNLEQVKSATSNALETEEKAKKWLIRMARDCNRYCKIMRMQQRRLSFADESGDQLCQIKVFHSSFATTESQNVLPRSLSVGGTNVSRDDEG